MANDNHSLTDTRNGQAYTVTMTRLADGKQITAPSQDAPWSDTTWGWWTLGNYSCDCNRFLWFERAEGRHPDPADEIQCGDQVRYRVDRFTFADGTVAECERPGTYGEEQE